MKGVFNWCLLLGFGLAAVAVRPASLFAGVTVYGEGAYTTSDLVVYIYADIAGDPLCSFGVKLTGIPSGLTVASAEKNEAVWYMGDGSTNHPYMGPDTSVPGEIMIIGGKLDTAAPQAGVTGERVLLGKVRLSHSDAAMPPALGLTYARDPGTTSYSNFVCANGTIQDGGGVSFNHPTFEVPVKIAERGDANGDGRINSTDYVAVRNRLNSTNAPPYADCNGDAVVNSTDYVCVRNKMMGL